MDYNQIKDLIKTISESDFTEFELQWENSLIRLGRGGAMTSATEQKPQATDTPITILPETKQEVAEGYIVKSPIVGTFYASPTPEKPTFVKAGDVVKKGKVLCILEAMKVLNDITCDRDGTIAEVFAQNGQMVEYGQSLFRIV